MTYRLRIKSKLPLGRTIFKGVVTICMEKGELQRNFNVSTACINKYVRYTPIHDKAQGAPINKVFGDRCPDSNIAN